MSPIYTHDRIKVSSVTTGPLTPANQIVYGGNAIQSITIGRNIPRDPQQAVGYRGVVDYTTGQVVSDITVDVILVEAACTALATMEGSSDYSVFAHAAQNITAGVTGMYVMTSCNLNFAAGQAATGSFSFIGAGEAEELQVQAAPTVEASGEEAKFAVVMGDDGSGIRLVPGWGAGFSPTVAASGIPVVSGSTYTYTTDAGLPAGVQSLSMAASINRDNVLDVRSSQPVQFITTYPLDISADIEALDPPTEATAAAWNQLQSLAVVLEGWGKHQHLEWAGNVDDCAALISGMTMRNWGNTVSVGQYLSHTVSFEVADLKVPFTVYTP
jgi:hypothetical protein